MLPLASANGKEHTPTFRGLQPPLGSAKGLKSRQRRGGLSLPSDKSDGNRKKLSATFPAINGFAVKK